MPDQGSAPPRTTGPAALGPPDVPGQSHGDGPGHRPVGPQGRPGQRPPLGAQRGSWVCSWLFAAGGRTQAKKNR